MKSTNKVRNDYEVANNRYSFHNLFIMEEFLDIRTERLKRGTTSTFCMKVTSNEKG